MAKFNTATTNALKDLYGLGQKPTSWDYRDFVDCIQDGIEGHEHRLGGGQGSGTGDAAPIEYFHQVLDVNMYNIHALLRLLATRPGFASYIPKSTWEHT